MVKITITKEELANQAMLKDPFEMGDDPADVLMCLFTDYWTDCNLRIDALDKIANLGDIITGLIGRATEKFPLDKTNEKVWQWVMGMDFGCVEFSVTVDGSYSLL